MDPKEYLPFLESMSALSHSNRRVAIDTHLKNFDSAVTCMAASGDYNEAIVRLRSLVIKRKTRFDCSL
jgi:hypothetical protein